MPIDAGCACVSGELVELGYYSRYEATGLSTALAKARALSVHVCYVVVVEEQRTSRGGS